MTIGGISNLLNKSPESKFTCSITLFAGLKIGVDWALVANSYMAVALKHEVNKINIPYESLNYNNIVREWMKLMIGMLRSFIDNNILPIIVFDGKRLTDKERISQDRRNLKEARHKEILQLYELFDLRSKNDTSERINQLYQLLNFTPQISNDIIIQQIRNKMYGTTEISSDHIELFKRVGTSIGIPMLQSTDDAERLCTSLCVSGHIAAVFSKDGDCLAGGCPLTIRSFNHKHSKTGSLQVDCIRLDRILYDLKVSRTMFIDICILGGCDYNGYGIEGIAAVKAYNLIVQHGSLENIFINNPRNDYEQLNHVRSRIYFSYEDPANRCIGEIILDHNINIQKDPIIDDLNITDQYNHLVKVLIQMITITGHTRSIPINYDLLQ